MKNKKLYLSIFFLILFIVNTILVKTNFYEGIDNYVHSFIIRFHSEFSTNLFKLITFFGSTLWIVVLTAIVFFAFIFFKRKNYAFVTLGLIVISTIINNVIKIIIKRPRPSYMPVGMESSYSYPSGHTMASVSLYGFFVYLILKSNFPKKYKIIYSTVLILLFTFIGISRIYLGAHYFSDVIGGVFISASLLLLISFIQDKKNILKRP